MTALRLQPGVGGEGGGGGWVSGRGGRGFGGWVEGRHPRPLLGVHEHCHVSLWLTEFSGAALICFTRSR